MSDAENALKHGIEYPYHGEDPVDAYERAVLGILAALSDRSGIGNALGEPDDGIKAEIVETLAEILRVALPPAVVRG